MSAWITLPIELAAYILLPIGFIVLFYKHLPRFKHGLVYVVSHGLVYVVSHGIAWEISGTCLTLAAFPFELGLFLTSLLFVATINFAIPIVAWLGCRLFRGMVLIQDGTLCETCGYNLTGNVSGKCPECGSSAELNPISERPANESREPI